MKQGRIAVQDDDTGGMAPDGLQQSRAQTGMEQDMAAEAVELTLNENLPADPEEAAAAVRACLEQHAGLLEQTAAAWARLVERHSQYRDGTLAVSRVVVRSPEAGEITFRLGWLSRHACQDLEYTGQGEFSVDFDVRRNVLHLRWSRPPQRDTVDEF